MGVDEPKDKALVDLANQGDAEAMTLLYRRHRDWVVSLAWQFLGSRDDALDAMQSVFSDLLKRFPGFELTSSMRAYLYPAVKHHCISLKRKRKKVVPLTSDHLDGVDLQWNRSFEGDFERLIRLLSHEHKEVVILRFGLGMSLDEIAASLDIPVGTAKSRLHNALKKLRKIK